MYHMHHICGAKCSRAQNGKYLIILKNLTTLFFCQIHLENGSDQGYEFHHHHRQTSLTSLCTVTLNLFSLYTVQLYSTNMLRVRPVYRPDP